MPGLSPTQGSGTIRVANISDRFQLSRAAAEALDRLCAGHAALQQHIDKLLSAPTSPAPALRQALTALSNSLGAEVPQNLINCLDAWQSIESPPLVAKLWKIYLDNPAYFSGVDGVNFANKVADGGAVIHQAQPKAEIGLMDIAIVDKIRECSCDVVRDARIVFDLPERPSVASLAAFYEQGYHYIPHAYALLGLDASALQLDFDAGTQKKVRVGQEHAKRNTLAEIKSLIELSGPAAAVTMYRLNAADHLTLVLLQDFARQETRVPLDSQLSIIAGLVESQAGLRSELVHFTRKVLAHELDLSVVQPLVGIFGQRRPDESSCLEFLKLLNKHDGDELVAGSAILTDLLKKPGQEYFKYRQQFESGGFLELQRDMIATEMKAVAATRKDKPLDALRIDFLNGTKRDSEPVAPALFDRMAELYERIRQRADYLISGNESRLRSAIKELRETAQVLRQNPDELAVQYFADTSAWIFREWGVRPYNTQIIASLIMINAAKEDPTKTVPIQQRRGNYQQIGTGEGKSLMIALLSGYKAFCGKTVDIITSNSYLAARDARKYSPFYDALGLTCHLHTHNGGSDMSSSPDVIYTTNYDMIVTYLHARLTRGQFFGNARFQYALIDEADNLCIDLGRESVRISKNALQLLSEEQLRRLLAFGDRLGDNLDWLDSSTIKAARAASDASVLASDDLIKVLLHAIWMSRSMQENVDFIKKNGAIQIVDRVNTGRIRERTQWTFMHPFVALRQGLALPPNTGEVAQMSHSTFLARYKEIDCVSGSIGSSCDRLEFQRTLRLVGQDIPPHFKSRRKDHPLVPCYSTKELDEKILGIVTNRGISPVLIPTPDIASSRRVHKLLKQHGIAAQLLNDVDNFDAHGVKLDEDALVKRAGLDSTVTVSTVMSGRGTDLVPSREVAESEAGVIVIIPFYSLSNRVEDQLRGRCGRQGAHGTSYLFVDCEHDEFIRQLPFRFEHLVKREGLGLEFARTFCDFARRAHNLVQTGYRLQYYHRERAIQEIQEYFFNQAAKLYAEFETGMRRRHPALGSLGEVLGVPDPVTVAIETSWLEVASEMAIELRIQELENSRALFQKKYSDDQKPVSWGQIREYFEASFGMPLERFKNNGTAEQVKVVECLVDQYRRSMLVAEDALRSTTQRTLQPTVLKYQASTAVCLDRVRKQFGHLLI